jgi:hypothetical protein
VQSFLSMAHLLGVGVPACDEEVAQYLRTNRTGRLAMGVAVHFIDGSPCFPWEAVHPELGVVASTASEPPVPKGKEARLAPRVKHDKRAARSAGAHVEETPPVAPWATAPCSHAEYVADSARVADRACRTPTKYNRNMTRFYRLSQLEGLVRQRGFSLSSYTNR